ncbi:AGC/PKA protein kinase, variant 1 [Aphanomyces astaci]|uniref:cGMP-dependent protein kinase n=1 Tax=Aphanomyces astaci TaxID=112090 RepID=W4G719_APHAT|nr:AGC/PKA protein kinase, variant 1 [Aphanomyces astaci]ETV75507.1 AGC/PKA protein kinase, variant 1 [Aphanomyces astaci]|eukprot:XP_009835141.1 AGC/PKA protein kinase, variant 1 [Aphanomyces astaci]
MGCTLCTMVGDPAAGVPSATLPERQTDLERVEAQARVQSGVTSVTEGVVELMLRGRRHGIFNDDTEDGTTVLDAGDVTVDVPSTLSMEDNLLIVESLRANELFSCLEPPHLEVLAKRMTVLRVHGGDIVYTQGDMGDTLYIIKSGHFDVTTNDDRMRALVVGNSFGELGLLYKCIRTETVGLSDEGGNYGDLFCLKGRTFREIVAKVSAGSLNISKDALRKVPLLQSLTESQFDTVAGAVRALQFREGDIIVRKGEPGNVLYMIQAGTVVCTDIGALDDIELHDGEYFGERALMKDEPRAATVYAKTGVHVMALDREVFTSVLGPLQELIKHNLMMRSVQSIPLLKDLSELQKQQLIDQTPLIPYTANQTILTEGAFGNDFYIVVSGQVNVTQAIDDRVVHLNTLSSGDYFGEQAALQEVPARRNASVTAATAVECLVIDHALFQSIRKPIQTALESNIDARNQMSQDKIFAASISISTLERTKVLGIGSFGLVYIAKHVPTGRFVAVKEMYKARLETSKQMGHVLAEKDLLSSFHHPFILKYLVALQEERKVYIVTESLLGGELFQRIVNPAGVPTPLPMDSARFYAGCVVKALKYLHTRNVAYRDLKPENILLDSHGYAKIVDFGFAKKLTQKTYTLCGTPEYLAPEIVMGIGHGFMVDNWALGILIYEMVVGDSPFADIKDDHMTICRSILRGKVEFRKDADPEWRRLVEGLLTREPTKRMSCLAGAVESHPWFNGFAWDDLLAQKMPAPWTPNVVAGDDVRWFSPVDTDELTELKEWDSVSPEKDWSEF